MPRQSDIPDGRTSNSQGQRARDDMTAETSGDDPGPRDVGPGIISSDPAVLGMGAGDPGYTAEENDSGTPRRRSRKRARR